jgi:two-component system, NarL family, sensor histidine kinase DesK
MRNIKLKIDFGDLAGIGTWTLVLALSIYLMPNLSVDKQVSIWLVISLFIAYLICFLLVTKESLIPNSKPLKMTILKVQLLLVYLIMWLLPFGFLPILSIIWAAILPYYFSLLSSIIITSLVVMVSSLIYGFHWQEESYIFQGLLYFSFHLFSIFMMQNAKAAKDANAKAQSLNKELQATQQLLAEVSRQNERTRIARDLHDLLGHHLTALIINLQVAGHLTEGEAKVKVEQCHSLAKLLMSDVREAVTALRESVELDFKKMVDLMIDNIPNLKITCRIDTQLELENLDLAKALLSCIQESITNSLKHSGASEFWITMKRKDRNILLELVDNGQVKGKLIHGNGLTGMKERIEELSGSLTFGAVQNSLKINISIPL